MLGVFSPVLTVTTRQGKIMMRIINVCGSKRESAVQQMTILTQK